MHVMWRMSCSIYYLNQIPKSFPKHIQVVLLPKLWPSNISQQTVTFIIILLLEWRILVYFHAYMKQSNCESTADGRITKIKVTSLSHISFTVCLLRISFSCLQLSWFPWHGNFDRYWLWQLLLKVAATKYLLHTHTKSLIYIHFCTQMPGYHD